MHDDGTLLHEFAAGRSETAFAAIVRLHLNLVFATAFRQLGDRGMAEEVTQNVFLALANNAKSLRRNATLAGWLYRTTVNQCRARLRTELRRHHREQIAAGIASLVHEGDSIWSSLIPLLDEALLSLGEKDRLAVMLHYMEERPHREIGRLLGVGEDAARKRVDRVVEDLTRWFKKRGALPPAGAVIAALSLQNAQAASAGLGASIINSCATGVAATSTLSIFGIIMASTKLKIGVAAVALALAISAPILLTRDGRKTAKDPAAIPIPPQQLQPVAAQPLPSAVTPVTAALTSPPKTFFERIMEGDKELPMLSHDQAEGFLERNRTNGESLLTAYRVTHDIEYLRRAATNFPNDPHVVLRAVLHDAFPAERAAWIDRLKSVDPDNALASYLSANERLKNNDTSAALKEVNQASSASAFRDYVPDEILSLEEIYLAADHSPAEAKALAMCAVELPHVRELVALSRGMKDLAQQYRGAGEVASADAVIQQGLALSSRLQSIPDGGFFRLSQFTGMNLEKLFVDQLDPSRSYDFLNGSVAENLDQFAQREKNIREESSLVDKWFRSANEADILTYCDRMKVFGEAGASEWVRQRIAATP